LNQIEEAKGHRIQNTKSIKPRMRGFHSGIARGADLIRDVRGGAAACGAVGLYAFLPGSRKNNTL